MSVQTLSRGHDSQGKPFTKREVRLAGRDCTDTGRVVIGCAYVPPPAPVYSHAEHLQAALLDRRTEQPRPMWALLLGGLWRWC
jgi:hypothetical protein